MTIYDWFAEGLKVRVKWETSPHFREFESEGIIVERCIFNDGSCFVTLDSGATFKLEWVKFYKKMEG